MPTGLALPSRLALLAAALFGAGAALRAQAPAPAEAPAATTGGWSLHAQATYLYQWHFGFPSPYSGPNSFQGTPENDATLSTSLYFGRSLWSGAAVYYNPEFFQGYGLSHTVGLGGFPSGEAIKAGFPHFHYNTSRLYWQQIIGLGGPQESLDDGEDQVAAKVDVNRLIVTVGKFAANDLFDNNNYSHDARRQFMNWTLLESGAWDEPGDVLGFTGGAAVEWNTAAGELHYGVFMEPDQTNSDQLDHNLSKAHGQIMEYDYRYKLGGQSGTVRPFVFWNQVYSGVFATAAAEAVPSIASTRAIRSKPGAGVSWDQTISANAGVFVRLSWNDGRVEDVAYAEIDRAAAAGYSLAGTAWGRADDTFGLALALDGLSPDHQRYLARGGTGFTLGDGGLDYGPEQIVEAYYRIGLFGHLSLSPDWQYLEHPGYNRDRGGFSVYAVRAHLEF